MNSVVAAQLARQGKLASSIQGAGLAFAVMQESARSAVCDISIVPMETNVLTVVAAHQFRQPMSPAFKLVSVKLGKNVVKLDYLRLT